VDLTNVDPARNNSEGFKAASVNNLQKPKSRSAATESYCQIKMTVVTLNAMDDTEVV